MISQWNLKDLVLFYASLESVFLLEEVSYKYLVKMEFLRNKRTRKATKAILISRAKGRVIWGERWTMLQMTHNGFLFNNDS